MAFPTSRLRFPLASAALLLVLSPLGCGDLVAGPETDAGTGDDASNGSDNGGGNPDVPITPVPDAGAPPETVDCAAEGKTFAAPAHLECTGLFSDWAKKTVDANNAEYGPAFPMWADGAEVKRWIFLPANQKIDTADPNEWKFPVGTRAWQEMKLSAHRVETRYLWKRGASDWVRATYRWSDDESIARSVETGAQNVGGSSYTIPTVQQCDGCHLGRVDRLLGFEAVSLAQPTSTGLTLAALAQAGRLSAPVSASLVVPDDGTGRAGLALGWLHGNCGTSCHNASPSRATDLWLRLDVQPDGTLGALKATGTWQTAVNVAAELEPYRTQGFKRVTPNDTFVAGGKSLLPVLAAKRDDPKVQMPPYGSTVPDLAGVNLLRQWISGGNFL